MDRAGYNTVCKICNVVHQSVCPHRWFLDELGGAKIEDRRLREILYVWIIGKANERDMTGAGFVEVNDGYPEASRDIDMLAGLPVRIIPYLEPDTIYFIPDKDNPRMIAVNSRATLANIAAVARRAE